jgi:hypothetical protein
VHQQPLVRSTAAWPVLVPAHQYQPATQLLPAHVRVQFARLDRCGWVVGGMRLPGAAIPHDHVTSAVLALRDDPLEVEVLDRVILDTDREALHMRIQRRPPGRRPADQHALISNRRS